MNVTLPEVKQLFENFKIIPVVRDFFVLKIKDMQNAQSKSMRCLKDLERQK